MKLKYKSLTVENETKTGVAEAEDSFALAKELKERGETLVSAEEVGEKETKGSLFSISFGGVKLAEKITFAKNLAAMVDAGLTLSRALSVMERQTSKNFQKVIVDLIQTVEKGSPLSDAMLKHPKTFSSLFIAMVRAGEESGKLGESLRIVAEQMDRSFALRRRIRGAMMYPGIIISVMILIGILMLIFVVPTLTQTFVELNVELPKSTQLIIGVSDFLKNHIIISLGGILAIVFGFVVLMRTTGGRRGFEWVIMRIPIIKELVRQTNAARMARTFSSLLSSGVEVVSAMSITRDVVQNSYYKDALGVAAEEIQKGEQLSAVLARYEALYPPMVNEMIAVGEETGKLPDMLMQVAAFFEEEVDQKTKDMSTIIEPFLMVLIGGVVGFFALSMISPIYSLSSGF